MLTITKQPPTQHFAHNEVLYEVATNGTETSLTCELYAYDTHLNALLILTETHSFNVDKKAQFEISEVLKALFQYRFVESPASILAPRTDMVLTYTLTFITGEEEINTNAHYCTNGGVTQISDVLLTTFNMKFLTHHALQKLSNPLAIERLYFYVFNVFDSASITIETTNTNGIVATHTHILPTLSTNLIYEINLTPYIPTAAKLRVWYTIEGVQSEIRTFIVERNTYWHPHSFIYINSLGTYDYIHCPGKGTDSIEISRINYRDNRGNNLNRAIHTQNRTANTGFISLSSKRYLTQFLISTEAYEITQTKLIRIAIQNSKEEISKDESTLYNLTVEYQHTHIYNVYSPIESINNNIFAMYTRYQSTEIIEDHTPASTPANTNYTFTLNNSILPSTLPIVHINGQVMIASALSNATGNTITINVPYSLSATDTITIHYKTLKTV